MMKVVWYDASVGFIICGSKFQVIILVICTVTQALSTLSPLAMNELMSS